MREIKFRVWDGEKVINEGADSAGPYGDTEWISLTELARLYTRKGWEIMRYTGLDDKNGTEIYFGDIVDFHFHDPHNLDPNDGEEYEYEGTATIAETMNGGAGIWYKDDDHGMQLVAAIDGGQIDEIWPDEDLWTIEVIGNIYENPELLE